MAHVTIMFPALCLTATVSLKSSITCFTVSSSVHRMRRSRAPLSVSTWRSRQSSAPGFFDLRLEGIHFLMTSNGNLLICCRRHVQHDVQKAVVTSTCKANEQARSCVRPAVMLALQSLCRKSHARAESNANQPYLAVSGGEEHHAFSCNAHHNWLFTSCWRDQRHGVLPD